MSKFTNVVAKSPNFCATESCKDSCAADPGCTYYSSQGPDILYSKGGAAPPPGGGPPTSGPSPTPSGPAAPVFDLISSIKELQGLEEYLFSKLEDLNLNDPANVKNQNDLIEQINNLSTLRNDLFGQLGKIYINLDKNSQIERSALTDQITTTNMMEEQLNNLKSEVARILSARNNKKRMTEIGEYEYLRYSAHKNAMKTVAFVSLAILTFAYLLKQHLIPGIIARVGIIATISIGGVVLVKQVWDMVTRDNQNYNRFTQPSIASVTADGAYDDSVLEHDKKFFEQVFQFGRREANKEWGNLKQYGDKFKQALAGLTSLVDKKQYCWSQGLTYDQHRDTCVSSNQGGAESPSPSPSPSSNGQEGFQIVRAYQGGNNLKGAPFN